MGSRRVPFSPSPRSLHFLATHYQFALSMAINLSGGRECSFAQMWWNDGLDGLELLAWIATRVDFGSGQLAVSSQRVRCFDVLFEDISKPPTAHRLTTRVDEHFRC